MCKTNRMYRGSSILHLLFVAFLLLFPFPLFAISGELTWNQVDESVSYTRYQKNGEVEDGWTVLDYGSGSVSLDVSYQDVIYLQSSWDGIHWSESSFSIIASEVPHFSPHSSSSDVLHTFSYTGEGISRFRFSGEAWIEVPVSNLTLEAYVNPWKGEKLEVEHLGTDGNWGKRQLFCIPGERALWLGFGSSQYLYTPSTEYATSLLVDTDVHGKKGLSYGFSTSYTFYIRSFTQCPKDYRGLDFLGKLGYCYGSLGASLLGGIQIRDLEECSVQPSFGGELTYSLNVGSSAAITFSSRTLLVGGSLEMMPLAVFYGLRIGGAR